MAKLTAERAKYGGFVASCGDEAWLLSFRDAQALAACRAGVASARLRVRRSAYFYDEMLWPECEVFGIGPFTLIELQRQGLITKPEQPSALALTPTGRRVLDALLKLPGVELSTVGKAA